MNHKTDIPEIQLKEESLQKYENLEEKLNIEVDKKRKKKLNIEKKKKIERERERKEELTKLSEIEKEMKYLITANELKWGDYKELDGYHKMDEKLTNYKIACEDILNKKDSAIESMHKQLCLLEEEFVTSLETYQKGKKQ